MCFDAISADGTAKTLICLLQTMMYEYSLAHIWWVHLPNHRLHIYAALNLQSNLKHRLYFGQCQGQVMLKCHTVEQQHISSISSYIMRNNFHDDELSINTLKVDHLFVSLTCRAYSGLSLGICGWLCYCLWVFNTIDLILDLFKVTTKLVQIFSSSHSFFHHNFKSLTITTWIYHNYRSTYKIYQHP